MWVGADFPPTGLGLATAPQGRKTCVPDIRRVALSGEAREHDAAPVGHNRDWPPHFPLRRENDTPRPEPDDLTWGANVLYPY